MVLNDQGGGRMRRATPSARRATHGPNAGIIVITGRRATPSARRATGCKRAVAAVVNEEGDADVENLSEQEDRGGRRPPRGGRHVGQAPNARRQEEEGDAFSGLAGVAVPDEEGDIGFLESVCRCFGRRATPSARRATRLLSIFGAAVAVRRATPSARRATGPQ